jgi:hypothetical protein
MVASQCSDLMSGVMNVRKETSSHWLERFILPEYTATTQRAANETQPFEAKRARHYCKCTCTLQLACISSS